MVSQRDLTVFPQKRLVMSQNDWPSQSSGAPINIVWVQVTVEEKSAQVVPANSWGELGVINLLCLMLMTSTIIITLIDTESNTELSVLHNESVYKYAQYMHTDVTMCPPWRDSAVHPGVSVCTWQTLCGEECICARADARACFQKGSVQQQPGERWPP